MWLPLGHSKAQFTLHLDHSCLATCAEDTPSFWGDGVGWGEGYLQDWLFTPYLVIGVKLGRAGWLRPGDIAEGCLDLQRVWCVCLGGGLVKSALPGKPQAPILEIAKYATVNIHLEHCACAK